MRKLLHFVQWLIIISLVLPCLSASATSGLAIQAASSILETPELVKDINLTNTNETPYYFRVVGDAFYFIAFDPVHGHEVWKSDGTPAGTALLKDIQPGSGTSPRTLPVTVGRCISPMTACMVGAVEKRRR
jgi:ELWxxDGT repeat protein